MPGGVAHTSLQADCTSALCLLGDFGCLEAGKAVVLHLVKRAPRTFNKETLKTQMVLSVNLQAGN